MPKKIRRSKRLWCKPASHETHVKSFELLRLCLPWNALSSDVQHPLVKPWRPSCTWWPSLQSSARSTAHSTRKGTHFSKKQRTSEYPSESNCSRDHNHYCLVLLSLSILPMLCGMPPKHRDIQTVQGFNYALYCIVTKARIKYPFKPLYVEYHLYVRFYN